MLGRLGTSLAGGVKHLDKKLSEDAIRRVIAEPLQMGLEEAAQAIVSVANANMADAVRLVSIRRGYDPRDFALLAFGGAGALHGVDVARELGIPTVVVPPNPGVTSAMGCLLVDIQHDLAQMYTGLASAADEDSIEEAFVGLEVEASARLRHEGVTSENALLQRKISMRYSGQWRSLQVPMGTGAGALKRAVQTFHEQYEREFSFRQDGAPVEVYQLHLTAIGKTPKPAFRPAEVVKQELPEPKERREVYFGTHGWLTTPVFDRDELAAGTTFVGPAIINQLDSTTLVPPATRAEIDEWLNIRIYLEEAN